MQLRPFQSEALNALKLHDHTLLVSPTGSGKSLIFEEQILRTPKIRALLVTPLNALGRQHAHNFENRFKSKIPVIINPSSEPPNFGVWVVNPEQLKRDPRIKQWKPNFLIVDEVHCIWEWGSGFRPDFKYLLRLPSEWGIKKSFWCTATLPPLARAELLQHIPGACELGRFSTPSNLVLSSHKIFFPDRPEALRLFCEHRKNDLGIIFVSTRKMTEKLEKYFQLWDMPAWVYHAGMATEERLVIEQKLKGVERGVILATSAFGLGMNLAHIKYSVLFQPPFSLLSLMQSIGRATRTEAQAEGAVFWHNDDFLRYEWMLQDSVQRRDEFMRVKDWCQSNENKRGILDHYFNS